MDDKVRVSLLMPRTMYANIKSALHVQDDENVTRFVRKAVREELKRRGVAHTYSAGHVEEDDGEVPDWARAEAEEMRIRGIGSHTQPSLPPRTPRKV